MITLKTIVDIYAEDGNGRICEATIYPVPIRVQRIVDEFVRKDYAPGKWLYLHRVWTRANKRGHGYGSTTMGRVCDFADGLSVNVVLRVCPFDAKGLTERKLRKWYTEFGFMRLGKTDYMRRLYRI